MLDGESVTECFAKAVGENTGGILCRKILRYVHCSVAGRGGGNVRGVYRALEKHLSYFRKLPRVSLLGENLLRGSIREGWKQGLIEDEEEWLDMLEKRNLSAHTYNEKIAREIYRGIKERYSELLSALDKYMQDWQGEGE